MSTPDQQIPLFTDEAIPPTRASRFGKEKLMPVDFSTDLRNAHDTFVPTQETSPLISSPMYRHGGERFQLSRTRVAGEFLNCPCCFTIRAKEGAQNFPFPTFRVNIAHDHRLKELFDVFRKAGIPAPISKKTGKTLVPFQHEKMEEWRDALAAGLKWEDPVTKCVIQGAPDDIWQDPETGLLYVVEYKSTYRSDDPELEGPTMEGYMHQVEFYQFLLRKMGFKVSDRAFVLFVNSDPHANLEREVFDPEGEFYHMPHRAPVLRSFVGSDEWIPQALSEIAHLLQQDELPPHADGCDHGEFLQRSRVVDMKRDSVAHLKTLKISDEVRQYIAGVLEPMIFAADQQHYDVNIPVDSWLTVRDAVRSRISMAQSHFEVVEYLKGYLTQAGLSKILTKKMSGELEMIASNAIHRVYQKSPGVFSKEDTFAEAEALFAHDVEQVKAITLLKARVGKRVSGSYGREYLDQEVTRLVQEQYPLLQNGTDDVLDAKRIEAALAPQLNKIILESDLYGHAKNRIKTFYGKHWKQANKMVAPLSDEVRSLRQDCNKAYEAYIRFTILSGVDEKLFLRVAQEYLEVVVTAFQADVPVLDTMVEHLPQVVQMVVRDARIRGVEMTTDDFKAALDDHVLPLYLQAKALVAGRDHIEQFAEDESIRQKALSVLQEMVKDRASVIPGTSVPEDFVRTVIEDIRPLLRKAV